MLAHEICVRADAQGDPIVEERTYSFMPGTLEPLAHRDALVNHGGQRHEGEWVHYVNDPIGRPRTLISEQGQVIERLPDEVFGAKEDAAARASRSPLRFPGHYADTETGIFYNRYRFYDPETGVYLSPDPIGLAGGMQPFTYASNRPLSLVDPDGLAPVRASVQGPYSSGPAGSSTDVRSGQTHYGGGDRQVGDLHPAVRRCRPRSRLCTAVTSLPAAQRMRSPITAPNPGR